MKKTILLIAIVAALPVVSAARTLVPGKPAPGATSVAAATARTPTVPSAPLTGVLSGISIANKAVNINGKPYRMNEPLVLVIDKRASANGLIELADLRPGMKVSFRSSADADGVERVVELWVLSNPPASGERMRSRN